MNILAITALEHDFLGISIDHYIKFGTIIIVALLLQRYFSKLLTQLFFLLFKSIAENDHVKKFRELLERPIRGLILSTLFYIALNQFDAFFEKAIVFERHKYNPGSKTEMLSTSSFSLMELIDHVFFLCFIFFLIFLLVRIVYFLFHLLIHKAFVQNDRERQQILPLLRDVLVVVLWSFGFFTVLGLVFHVNVPTLIAGLGFGGIAIAFAAKESLENLLASFMIMLDKPFIIGDHIKIGTVEGKAERIGFRSTRIRTFDQTLISLPNKNLIGASLENFSERGAIRIKFKLNANYGLSQTSLKAMIEALKKAIDANEHTRKDATVYLDGFAASVELLVTYFVTTPTLLPIETIKQQVNFEVYKIMYEYGQGFAFPKQVSLTDIDINQVEL